MYFFVVVLRWSLPGLETTRIMSSPKQELFDLFRRLFSVIELQIFVSFGNEGEDILCALPRGSSIDSVAVEVVEQLARRGLVTAQLFHRLVRDRPSRSQEISQVARAWGIDSLPSL